MTLDIVSIRSTGTLSDEDMQILAEALPRFTHLKTLSLPHAKISTYGSQVLAAALQNTLETLILNDNELCDDGVMAISDKLVDLPHLKTLALANTQMTDAGVIYLAKKIPKQLESLLLVGHHYTPNAAHIISTAVMKLLDLQMFEMEKYDPATQIHCTTNQSLSGTGNMYDLNLDEAA